MLFAKLYFFQIWTSFGLLPVIPLPTASLQGNYPAQYTLDHSSYNVSSTFPSPHPLVSVGKWFVKADSGWLFQLMITANAVLTKGGKKSLHDGDVMAKGLGIWLWSLCFYSTSRGSWLLMQIILCSAMHQYLVDESLASQ